MTKLRLYWKLFCSTFYLSAFTFGGGFVIVPLMQKKFVDDLKWIEQQEIVDITAIAQSSPGAIAINTAVLIGYKTGGFIGAVVSLIGVILPPLIIISVISLIYNIFITNKYISAFMHGMQAGVAAVICDVAIKMVFSISKEKKTLSFIIMPLAFIAVFFFKINVALILLSCILIAIIAFIIKFKQEKKVATLNAESTANDAEPNQSENTAKDAKPDQSENITKDAKPDQSENTAKDAE